MNPTKERRLAGWQTIIYALPALPLAFPTLVLFVNLPTLYLEEFGLSLTLTGLLIMLARVGDLLLDPIIGILADRLSSDQQRLMIGAGGLCCAPGLLLIIYPISEWIGASLFVGLTLLYFGWTLVQIPYLSLLPRLHSSTYERTRIASWREGLGVIGLLCSAAIPAALVAAGSSSLESLRELINYTLILGAIALGFLLFALKWPSNSAPVQQTQWKLIFKNREARYLLGSWFSNGLANGIPAVLFPLYITYVLVLPEDWRSYLILLYFACAIFSLPVWLKLSQTIDKDRLWKWAMILAITAFLPAAFLGEGDTTLFLIICILTGFTLGADLALPQAMQADVTDWHRVNHGRDQTALLFAVWNMATKLALALAALLALGSLELSGFDQELNDPGYLALIYALLPCVLKMIAVFQLNKIDLSHQWHRSIVQKLNA